MDELRESLADTERRINSCTLALQQLKKKEAEYQFHINRMARGEPKPGKRRLEEDFDPAMMAKGLSDIQESIRQHKKALRMLEKQKVEHQLQIGGIFSRVVPSGRIS